MLTLRLELNNIPEIVTNDIIHKLYTCAIAIPEPQEGEEDVAYMSGNLLVVKAYKNECDYLEDRFLNLHINCTGDYYITFADSEVESVLRANNVSSDGVGITLSEALAVNTIPASWFRGNTTIQSFNELSLFGSLIISEDGFRECTNLRSIDLTNVTLLRARSFYGCSNLTGDINLPNVVIKNQETGEFYIGGNCFYNTSITSLTVPDNVLTITGGVCQNCHNLTSVTCRGAINLYEACFDGCENLETLITSPLEKIYNYVFRGCKKLNLEIPNTIKHIGLNAATNRSGGTGDIFVKDTSLTNLEYIVGHRDSNTCLDGIRIQSDSGQLNLPSLTHLGDGTLLSYGGTSINIPNLETFNANKTFRNCPNLISVTIDGTFTELSGDFGYGGGETFKNCPNLTSITIVPTVTKVTYGLFEGISNSSCIINMDFSSLTHINGGLFKECNANPYVLCFPNATTMGGRWANDTGNYFASVFSSNTVKKSVYLPKITRTSCPDGVLLGVPKHNTFSSQGINSRYNTIYFKDILNFEVGTFSFTTIDCVIINNTTVPLLIINTEHSNFVNSVINANANFGTYIFLNCTVTDIYVPDAAVSDYQSATQFADVASKIKPLSQCPRVTLLQLEAGSVGLIEAYM